MDLLPTPSLAILLALASPSMAQEAGSQDAAAKPVRTSAQLFKSEVDGLIRLFRQTAREGALGDASCRQTAMVLTAAGHSHRFYFAGDGPWLRAAVQSMFAHRQSDGSFADGADDDATLTTRWVLGALRVMDPRTYTDDIELAERFVTAKGASTLSPLVERARALQTEANASGDPVGYAEQLGAKALSALPRDPSQPPSPAAALKALVGVVPCQMVARGKPLQEEARGDERAWTDHQQRALAFLMAQQKDGVFYYAGRFPDVGLTGIGLAALQTKPTARRTEQERAAIDGGLAWVLAQQNEEGSFGRTNLNYSTCAAVMALAKADEPRFKAALAKAQKFLLFLQNADDRGYAPDDRDYGSIGYGGDERGDLSNLQFALEALTSTGLDAQHEAYSKALKFLQRTQNRKKTNDFKARTRNENTGEWQEVGPGDDGGAAYYPGNSPAGYTTLADGTKVPRSYGSMTYALLKAYILCGLPADDPRILAAVDWIQKNFTVDENPGADSRLPDKARYQGLFYYYMVMAQALATAGLDTVSVGETEHDWRAALGSKLAELQRPNGAWLNERNGRWWEDQELVCTVYALIALEHCHR